MLLLKSFTIISQVGGQAVLGRQLQTATPWLTERHGYDPTYRYEPPPEFPLASPYAGIVHHLSGPNRYALTQIFHYNFSFPFLSENKKKIQIG